MSRVSNLQYAVLPWRQTAVALQVLLITTRNRRRWIVPKGWPMEGRTPAQCAAQEALEEAGVVGEILAETLGYFRYNKERKSGDVVPCIVRVFTMEVAEQREDWIEKAERETLAVLVELAADAVEVILSDGAAAAQNRFNSTGPVEP